MQPAAIGLIINLVKRPTAKQANAIQKAFGNAGEFLDVLAEWPESFTGLKTPRLLVQTSDVEFEPLLGNHEAMNVPALHDESEKDRYAALELVLSKLTPKQQSIIESRYWHDATYEEAGKQIKSNRERARQLEASALRRMRFPEHIRTLQGEAIPPASDEDVASVCLLSNQAEP